MEIHGLALHRMEPLAAEADNLGAGDVNPGQPARTLPTGETAASDRLELVRTQNLASPLPLELDTQQAARMLRQVTGEIRLMERQDMRHLYDFDRLRDLCCRRHNAATA